jgi:hypothetical protein
MGFFSGLFGAFKPPAPPQPPKPYLPYNRSGVGHVLDVILDKSHPQYNPDENRVIGTIFYRNAFASPGGTSFSFMEALLSKQANPLNRSNFKVPLPGEQVLIYDAKFSKLDGPDVFMTTKTYYGEVVSITNNITSNSAPFIGIDPDRINPFLPGARTVGELSRRFDKKIKNLDSFKDSRGNSIVRKQVSLNEGDFILQGRFGGSIRFAGTPIDSQVRDQDWAKGKQGTPGDPIVLMRVDNGRNEKGKLEDDAIEVESINEDGTSLYLVSTQQIPLELALPDKGNKAHPLASWANTYGIEVLTDVKKTAGKAKDGEAARSGANKTAPKEGNKAEDVKVNEEPPSTTASPTDTPQDETPIVDNEANDPGSGGYNGFYTQGQTGLSGIQD